jgi:hypothetical protein
VAELVGGRQCPPGCQVSAAKQELEPANIEKHVDDPFRYAVFLVKRGSRRRRSSILLAKW